VGATEHPVLRHLRGDFFCAPFGVNTRPFRGRHYPLHGEISTRRWRCLSLRRNAGTVELVTELQMRASPGEVRKLVHLRPGETNLYIRHTLTGFSGAMCLGHHTMLAFPTGQTPGQIALSPWHQGRVSRADFEDPARGGYTALRPGAGFDNLRRVPLANGGWADLTTYPAREGFEDLVMVSSQPDRSVAWASVIYPDQGYLWFALKDPRVLASTVLWLSNGGRHYPPWSGRHRRVLGVEDVTSYFDYGLAESARSNPLSRAGIPTVLNLSPSRPLVINYIMGVVPLPRGFDRVRTVSIRKDGLVFKARSGHAVRHPVELAFLDYSP
jgi:hypothetical protein